MEKIARGCGLETNTEQDKAECWIGLKTHVQVLFFHIAQAWQCFSWFKAFLVKKLFALATFSNSKFVTHVTNSAVISTCSTVFSRVLYGKTALLFI